MNSRLGFTEDEARRLMVPRFQDAELSRTRRYHRHHNPVAIDFSPRTVDKWYCEPPHPMEEFVVVRGTIQNGSNEGHKFPVPIRRIYEWSYPTTNMTDITFMGDPSITYMPSLYSRLPVEQRRYIWAGAVAYFAASIPGQP